MGLERILSTAGHWISGYDTSDDCGDGESLLDGRISGEHCCLPGLSVQPGVLGAAAAGRSVVVGVEIGETGSVDGGAI